MGRQDQHRGTDPIPEHLLDCGVTRIKWHEGRRVLEFDIAFRDTEALIEVVYGEWVKQFDPCIIIEAMDMGSFTTHFAGALVDDVYCTSGISGFVYDLMTASLRSEQPQDVSHTS